ncbi:hypothetical protein ERJ75_000387700 [Trypanosoma vivax]|nr:hypothetical protein ERJ75_000387700 [Trypanosoma vivax]
MRRALLPSRLCATSFGRVVRVLPALARRQPRCKRWCSLHVAGGRVPTHALGRVWLCPLTRVRLSCFHSASWSRCVPAKFALRAFRRRRASLRLVPPHSSVAGGCRRCTLPAQGVGSEWRGPAVTVRCSAVSLLCSALAGPFSCGVFARETASRGPSRKDATRPRWRSSAHLPVCTSSSATVRTVTAPGRASRGYAPLCGALAAVGAVPAHTRREGAVERRRPAASDARHSAVRVCRRRKATSFAKEPRRTPWGLARGGAATEPASAHAVPDAAGPQSEWRYMRWNWRRASEGPSHNA